MAAKSRPPSQTGPKFVTKIANVKMEKHSRKLKFKNKKRGREFPALKFCKSRGNLSGSSLHRNRNRDGKVHFQ